MLQTQVAYWTLQENKRHNLVTEQQGKTDLNRRAQELKQTIKFQTAEVNYWKGQLKELTRHNKMTEKLSKGELKTKQNQAKASLMQAVASLQQSQAALENVEINRQNAETNAKNASTKKYEAKTGRMTAKANIKKTKSERKLADAKVANVKMATKLSKKDLKWYDYTKVMLPSVKVVAEAAKDVAIGAKYGRD